MPNELCFPSRRDVLLGLFVFVVLGNVTFFSFLWGDRTLQNSARFASLYAKGSVVRPLDLHAPREADPTAGDLQTEPWFALEREQIVRDHRLPLWNPYSGYGVPLAANMQSQPYSPFAWIGILWLSARGYDAFVALRIVAAGFLAFLYVRTFVGRAASLAGGAAYMFTGYLWLYLSLPQLSVEVLTPGVLLAVECVMRRPSSRSSAGLAAILGVSLLGGMPESSALAVLFAASYAAARLLGDRSVRRTGRRAIVYLALGFALGAGASAIAVVPFLELVRSSSNSHQSGVASLLDLPPDPVTFRALAQYLAPLMFGPPDGIFAIGLTPLLRGFFGSCGSFFALLALFSTIGDAFRKRPRSPAPTVFFAATAAIFLTRRFGFALTAPIGKLPVLHQVLLNKYEEGIVALCVAVLVAFGVQRLRERRFSLPAALLASGLPLIVLAIAHRSGVPLSKFPDEAIASRNALVASCTFLLLAATLATIALARRSVSGRALAGAAFVIATLEIPLVFVLPLYYGKYAGMRQENSALLGSPYVTFLTTHLRNGERFYGENYLLTPNWSSTFGISDVRDLDALYPARYFPFARAFLGNRDRYELVYFFVGTYRIDRLKFLPRRFLDLSSVRYYGIGDGFVTPVALPSTAGRLVFSSSGANIYELPPPVPRAALYRKVVLARDGPDALRILRSPGFSPEREAVVEGDGAELEDLAGNAPSPVQSGAIETNASGDVRVSVATSATTFLVVNDTNFPGWNATIDGRAAPILNANYLFRGVVVPKGEHVVAFRYAPASFAIGAAISLASLIVIAFMLSWPWRATLRDTPARWPLGSSSRSSSSRALRSDEERRDGS